MQRERIVLLAAISILTGAVCAQDPIGGEIGRQLDELRKKNEALEERVTTLESGGSDESVRGLGAKYGDVTATFKVFGDVGFDYRNPEAPGEGHSHFALGSVDFFANVQFGDHFRILSESVLDARGGTRWNVDQERLWAMWTVNDQLYVKLGTEHSPVSRWNQLYHHGHWLETSISRPLLAAFEGEDGIVAMHTTGLEFGGRQQTSVGGLEWFLGISNGRGAAPTNKQRAADRNDSKKVDVGLAFMPSGIPDLRVGAAVTYDEIPTDPTSMVAGRMRSMRELVASAHAQYRNGPFDVIGEFAWIEHESRELATTYHHDSGYLQASWQIDRVTPYARMDYRAMTMGDPFYSELGRDLDIVRPVVGVRYDPTESLASKLEVGFSREELFGGSDRDVVTVAFQVSWVL